MAVTARTWVEGEIATAAKLNTLRDDLLSLDTVAGIKSVQHGTVTILNGNLTGTASITAVVLAKSALIFLGNTIEPGSGIGDGFARISLTSTTQVTATRASSGNVCVVGFCVVEYK